MGVRSGEPHCDRTPGWHGFHRVLEEIEPRLFESPAVELYRRHIGSDVTVDANLLRGMTRLI